MHVKSVELNGFKSYKSKTYIGEFDPHFNAITGLNGSGKSNILDGIIFVLGLSSLQTVRAQNLNDLIHKGGNITRGSATIIFDNTDKKNCPLGYEKFSEIVVSRTVEEGTNCKYILNGLNSTKKAIQDMFESVQLNINNPNFMIMQGKITKVVNMKPKETLIMIEECVGATIYKAKRDKAVAEMGEKQKQIKEIEDTMKNVVLPAIMRQKEALQMYHNFKEVERNRHKMAQEYAIAAYGHYLNLIAKKEEKVNQLQTVDNDDAAKLEDYAQRIKDKQQRRDEIRKESQRIATEKVAGVEKELKEERKKLTTQEVGYETACSAVKEGEVNLKKAQKALAAEEKQVEDFRGKSAKLIEDFNTIQGEIKDAKVNEEVAKQRESEIQGGKVIGEDGQTFDLRERLVKVEDEIVEIRPKHDHEGRFLESEEKNLREMETKLSKTPSDKQIENDFKAAEKELDGLQHQLQQLKISPEKYKTSDQEYNAGAQRLNVVEAERRQILKDFNYLAFDYTAPTPNFNHNSIHGNIFELFEAPNLGNYQGAFEVAVQSSLTTVVVDNADTAKAIIKHGNVATRRTYMPLSKVRKLDRPPPTQRELDNKVGPGKAVCVLSLMNYDPKYDDLMKSYFGRTILCDTMETAKKVAYQMKFKAITMEGDVCDSDGGMQGGTRRGMGRLITACQKLRPLNSERKAILEKLRELKAQMDHYNKNAPVLKKFEMALRRLENAAEERKCTAYAALLADINTLKETIKERKTKMAAWGKELEKLTKEQKTLRKNLESIEDMKKNSLKTAQAEISKWKKALEAAQKKYDARKATFDGIALDLKAKETLLAEYRKDIEDAEKELAEAKVVEADKKLTFDEARVAFEEKEKEQNDAAEEYRAFDQDSARLEGEIAAIQKKIQKIELSKLSRDNDLKNAEEQLEGTRGMLTGLVNKHPELKLPTNYEKMVKPTKKWTECKNDLEKMEKEYEELRQTVDLEVVEKLAETHELEKISDQKLKMLHSNKRDMQNAIDGLNKQMEDKVKEAFEEVNQEFAAMMNTLLEDSSAKLVPVKDVNHLEEGLNIHVRLGDVWKESLTELSGGQRSLVALALTLSLCMYQPAPFYVLDEIDAALDLSHTQNIGVLIKKRFKDTQFICVSLKDGMYTNANVLFTTEFHDGESRVKRFPPGKGGPGNGEACRGEEAARQKGQRRLLNHM